MLLIITGIIGAIIFIFIICSRINVSFNIVYSEHEKVLNLKVYMYRIRLYNKVIDFTAQQNKEEWDHLISEENILQTIKNLQSELKTFMRKTNEVKKLLIRLLRKSRCNELSWTTYIGTGEPSTTGLISGSLWMIKGTILGFISRQCELTSKPVITVTPTFQQRYVYTDFNCMLSIKVGQTIYIFLKR